MACVRLGLTDWDSLRICVRMLDSQIIQREHFVERLFPELDQQVRCAQDRQSNVVARIALLVESLHRLQEGRLVVRCGLCFAAFAHSLGRCHRAREVERLRYAIGPWSRYVAVL